ncbi:hypothetical protein [Neobacillus niacini]|uniref:hypothetical protein n=1 Tax=Neobacillus niacini TaxID=86668 RepID=UPI0021CAFD55|nr:hypothetical protein [Neobacillus niacini]MCM3764593.1 hypothetical protein [Neobacillus niacini]
MKSKNILYAFSLLLTLGLLAYLESPFSFLNSDFVYIADQPAAVEPVAVEPEDEGPELIEKLVKREKVDGYIVETYQEYEVYKDEKGNITDEVPTSKVETLRYYDYKK